MKNIRSSILLVIVLAVVLSGCAFGGAKRIPKNEALQIALTDAGLTKDQVVDVDIELERNLRYAWYEIDFESGSSEYEYRIDAYSGEILSGRPD